MSARMVSVPCYRPPPILSNRWRITGCPLSGTVITGMPSKDVPIEIRTGGNLAQPQTPYVPRRF